jgi:transposase InsO family protein
VSPTEICGNETAVAAIGVLRRAVGWFADHGITVGRVLSDNGSCYRSTLWKQTCTKLDIKPKYTRTYRPQTNGKTEHFNRPWPLNVRLPATIS